MIELGLVTKAPKVPSDIGMLMSVATLSFCPVKGAERRARVDHLAVLISETLVANELV